jgi:hypothetical protein
LFLDFSCSFFLNFSDCLLVTRFLVKSVLHTRLFR